MAISKLSSIHQSCRDLWVKGLATPTTIDFATSQAAARARFTMYDAVRKERKAGEGPADIMEAIAEVELVLSKDKCSITVQRRSRNPFYAELESQLAGVSSVVIEAAPAPEAQSLARFQEALAPEPAPESINPYYTR